ncbi:MAG: hypothetical protein IJI98_08405, partial [Methanosphaera sp.]|nr:hypothetical protein [Methanosphaera sp.]
MNGNNHILDGSGLARILSVNNCVLNDIVFVNGSAQDGGAIQGSNAHVNNCTFMNNTGTRYGSTIMCNSFNITNCVFKDNPGANSNINFNTGTNYCYNNTFYDSGKVTNSDNDCVVVIQYNSFLNGGYPDVRSHTDASYNWFGYNRESFNNYPCLNATLNFVSVKKENDKYVYVFNVTFVKSDTGDVVCVNWTRPVNYTITNNNNASENISGLNTDTSWLSGHVLFNLSANVDNQFLSLVSYPFTVLSMIIDYYGDNSHVVLVHDYTYDEVVDNPGVGVLIAYSNVTVDGNGHRLDALMLSRVLSITSDNVTLSNILLNHAKYSGGKGTSNTGGFVRWAGLNGKMSNVTVNGSGVSCVSFGGFIQGGNLVCVDCTFQNIVASYGAVFNDSKGTMINCTFLNNHANLGGVSRDSDINYINCTFKDNYGSHNTQGSVFHGGDMSIDNCIFIGNHGSNGGVFYNSKGNVINSIFNGNYAVNGGVFYNYNGYIVNSTFINNTASSNGAVVYSDGKLVNITGCNFTNNHANYGGAVYLMNTEAYFDDCMFMNNVAINGSAIYIVKSLNYWCDLIFNSNVASNNATVYFNGDSTVYSNNLSFTGNVIPNALHIVGTDHIYSPLLYVNSIHSGFGIIAIEPISLEKALDNILPGGKIIMMRDYTLNETLKVTNLNNIT